MVNRFENKLKAILLKTLQNECDNLFLKGSGEKKEADSNFILEEFHSELEMNDEFIAEMPFEKFTLDYINATEYYIEFEDFLTQHFKNNVLSLFKEEADKLSVELHSLEGMEILNRIPSLKELFDKEIRNKVNQYQ